jgi:uncharacterized repeat protein (TIGR01451 family)
MKRVLLLLLLAIPGVCHADSDLLWNYRIGSGVWTVDMSESGEYVAAGTFTSTAAGYEQGIYLFDKTGRLLWEHNTDDVVWSVSMSGDGDYIVAGSKDKNVYLLDTSGALLWKYEVEDTVWTVAISKDGEYIAAGSYDNNVYLFDKSGSLLWKYKTDDIVLSTSISKDGEYIAAGSYDNQIYYFENSGALLWKYRTNNVLFATSISEDGEYIAAGSYDNSVYLFDKFGNSLFEYETKDEVWGVAISGDGEYIAAASKDSSIYFFSSSGDLLGQYSTEGFVSSVAISKDGGRAAAGSYDRSVSFFSITPLAPVERMAPKLEVTKSVSDSTITRGEEVTVSIELKNTGDVTANLVEFSDEMPEGFTLLEGELSYMTDIEPGTLETFSYVMRLGEIREQKEVQLPSLSVSYMDIVGNQYTAKSSAIFVTLIPKNTFIPVYTIRYRLGAIIVSILDNIPGGAPVSNTEDLGGKIGTLISSILKLAFVVLAVLILFVLLRGITTGRKTRKKVDKAEILMKIRKEVGAVDPSTPQPMHTSQEPLEAPATKRRIRRFKFAKSTFRKEKIDLLKSLKNEVKTHPEEDVTDFTTSKPQTRSFLSRLLKLGEGKSTYRKEKINLLKSLKKEVRK